MKPSVLATTLESMLGARRPTFVWGPPGVCKSSVIRQVADKLKRPVVDIRAVLLDPVDLRGLPKINGDGKAHWCPPAFLPYEKDSTAIVFLDELAQAPPLVQSACLQLTLDRRLGEYTLPDGCVIVAASNRQEDRAGAHRLISPLLNRFVHLEVELSNEDWENWAIGHGIDHRILAFIRFKPGSLMVFDPKSNAKAFPTPRSWEFASDCLKHADASGLQKEATFEVIKGCVGEGAAAEYSGFAEVYSKLPNPRQVLMNPDKYPVPEGEPSVLYALSGALIETFRQDKTLGGALMKYAKRMPAEFGVLTARDAAFVDKSVLETAEGAEFIKKNSMTLLGDTKAAGKSRK